MLCPPCSQFVCTIASVSSSAVFFSNLLSFALYFQEKLFLLLAPRLLADQFLFNSGDESDKWTSLHPLYCLQGFSGYFPLSHATPHIHSCWQKEPINPQLLEELLSLNKQKGKEPVQSPIVFSTPFSPQYREITSIIKKYLPVLLADEKMVDVLETPIKYVARRACTIGNMVSPSAFPKNKMEAGTQLSTMGFYICGHIICKLFSVQRVRLAIMHK